MKKFVGILSITILLIMPLLLVIPLPVIAQPQEALSDAVGGGTGGEFWLDPDILYTGGVTITGDTRIYGQGATIDLQSEKIEVIGTYLYIERCTITNATVPRSVFGALEFYDDASGFIYYNTIIDNNDNGIVICESSDIVIKENSILYSSDDGIRITDSTDITILENIISHNGGDGIHGYNSALYNEDPNSLHGIKIKGNEIFANGENSYFLGGGNGINLEYVNGVSISSNLIYSNKGNGTNLEYCPIVSITYNKIIANSWAINYIGDEDWPIINEGTADEVEVELSLTISNNKMMGNYGEMGAGQMPGGGILIMIAQNIVITYNEIVGNLGYGIVLAPSLYGGVEDGCLMEPVFVAYNTIKGNMGGLIMVYISDVSILFNKIEGNYMGVIAQGAEDSKNVLIKGNVVNEHFYSFALILMDFDAQVTIEWNTILGNGLGVTLNKCENPQILHNTIMYQSSNDVAQMMTRIMPGGLMLDDCDGGRIAFNTISYNKGNNIGINQTDDVVVEYNNLIGAYLHGINITESDDATIKNNIITNNFYDGIHWYVCSGLITDNMIGYSGSLSGNDNGISLIDAGITTISENTIIGNLIGINCSGSDPTIIRNYIANNVYGIWLGEGPPISSDPLIGGSPSNRNYIIKNSKDGVFIFDTTSNPTINYNNIFENVGYGINNHGASVDIDAENNFWGDISGPGNPATFGVGPGSGDEITNKIMYSPWLVSINP